MAIELKSKGLLKSKKVYFFVDGPKKGKEYKTQPTFFENSASIEEAEFLADLAAAPNAEAFAISSTYPGKKAALGLLAEDVKERLTKAIESAEFEAKKKDTVSAFVDLAKKGNAEAGDYDHKKMAALISEDLIEFPLEIAEDERVQDSKGYAFLMEIIGKSSDAIIRRYQSALSFAEGDPLRKAKITKNYEANAGLFVAEISACIDTLLANKIESLAAEIESTKTKTAEMEAKIAELKELATSHRTKAQDALGVINRFKQSMRDSKKAKDGAVGEMISGRMEEVVAKTGELGEATAKHDETAEKLIDAKAFSDAMTQVLNGLNETKVQMLFRQMVLSGIDVPEAEIAEFLTSGKIPASLKLKNPTKKEISALYHKVIADAKKIKAEILKGAKEPEPGDE